MNYTEKSIRQAVTEAYEEGYKDGRKSAKAMLYAAFDIWESAENKAKLNVREKNL